MRSYGRRGENGLARAVEGLVFDEAWVFVEIITDFREMKEGVI